MVDLRQGDCLELLRDLPDGSVDLVLNDPPYGTTANAWDTPLDMALVWPELWRVCKPDAAVLLFAQLPFLADLVRSDRRNYRYDWVIHKPRATGFLNAAHAPLKCHEEVLVFFRRVGVYHPQFERGEPYYSRARSAKRSSNYRGDYAAVEKISDGRRYPQDILSADKWTLGGTQEHPTQKPVPLLEYFVRTYTDQGGVVLDHTMGSGSTGVACVNDGRSFIGFERDAGYFEIASRRLAEAQERKANEDAQMKIGGIV